MSTGNFATFALAIRQRESSNNYRAVSPAGYCGAYQFGMARLCDLGYTKRKPGVTGYGNVAFEWRAGYSQTWFLSDAKAQDAIFREHVKRYLVYFAAHPTGIEGASSSGLVAAAHLVGVGGVKRLAANEPVADANGTKAETYLQEFSDYDLSEMLVMEQPQNNSERWQSAILTAIGAIKPCPWVAGGSGTTRDVLWRGTRILKAKVPPTSFCSGAQIECFLDALRLLGMENTDGLDATWARKAMLAAFCRIDLDPIYNDGLPGYLVRGRLAQWVPVEQARLGDICQIWWEGAEVGAKSGHATVIALRKMLLKDGGSVTEHPANDSSRGPVVWDWSSNLAQKAAYAVPARPSGHHVDYRTIKKGKRIFHVARPTFA